MADNAIRLDFNEKERFRILCVSDIHGGVGYDEENTVAYLSTLLDKTQPDLVLMLGDIAGPGVIHIENAEQLAVMLKGLTAPMVKRRIPFAHVFGNHDDNYGLPNREAEKVYESMPFCVSRSVAGTAGASDYMLPIYDGDKIAFAVYGLDSHRGMDGFREDYDVESGVEITFRETSGFDVGERGTDSSQVRWYCETSEKLEKEQGGKVPALMVMHVPVQEFCWAAMNPEQCKVEGIMGEPVSGQMINSGLFRACMERGDVKAMCFGHDHENTITAEFGGITMAYDGYVSCHACHLKPQLGGRVFDVYRQAPGQVHTAFVNVE